MGRINFLKRLSVLLAVAGGALLSGCATTRSEVKLTAPAASTSQAPANGRVAVIRAVKDVRVFEQAPATASIPSLGFEGASQATLELKARAIGRKRNGFGKALGDVVLENGQTVEGVVRANLTAALQQAGFQVRDMANAGPSPLIIDVRITQFWAWLQPGFGAVTLNSNIETALDLSGPGAGSLPPIMVHTEDSRQIVTESAWIEIVDKGLATYRAQASGKLSSMH